MSDSEIGVYIQWALFCIIATSIAAAILAWDHAPEVGGKWWPYIRTTVTFIAAIIGAKLGAVFGYLSIVWAILSGGDI